MPHASGSTRSLGVLALLLGLGCSSPTENPQPTAAQLGLAVAPPTASASGALLSPQPVVRLEDAAGAPVAVRGRLVTVRATPQGAILGGTLDGRSDADGRVAFSGLSVSGPAGAVTLIFESTGLRSVTAVPLQLSAGAPASMEPVPGANFQTAVAGNDVAVPPAVQVNDGAGNPVAGVPVVFAVTGGGGSVVGGSVTTGANGRAAVSTWTLGTSTGLNTLSATSTSMPGVSVVFTATGTVGPPTLLEVVAGNGQTAVVGGAVAIAPSVKLTDALGHPVANVAVTFTATSGGGSVTIPNPLTDNNGIARVGAWALGLEPGSNTLTASRAGVASVSFGATAVAFVLASIDAGGDFSCGINAGGAAFCWGANDNGQLGDGTTTASPQPVAVTGSLVFSSITTGRFHSCGLVGSTAYCWGGNSLGQLGDGTNTNRSAPVPVAGGLTFIALDAGDQFTCGLVTGGAARCWGRNAQGQLGDGTQTTQSAPVVVSGGLTFASIDAGSVHACARQAGGALYCWGSNGQGRLGDGTTTMRLVPTPVTGGLSFALASAGDSFTCGITGAGAGYCWGNGADGFLGTGGTTSQSVPTPLAGTLVLSAVHTSGAHTCGVTAAGAAHCWGFNGSGELGDGTFVGKSSPAAVSGGVLFSRVRSGIEHTCGLSLSGIAYCWGKNSSGGLGDGTTSFRSKPVGVLIP